MDDRSQTSSAINSKLKRCKNGRIHGHIGVNAEVFNLKFEFDQDSN
jgi:hypothetical protein